MSFVLFYDSETNKLPEWKMPSGHECQPHLVELSALLVNRDTREIVDSLDVIIKPEGWEISEDNAAIHGITQEKALAEGIPEAEAYERFMTLWAGCHRVAHNRTFDQRMIRIAAKRYGTVEQQEAWAEKETHECSMLLAKPIMQLLPKGRYGYKNPKLEEAYEFFTGKQLEGAHRAMNDTRGCMAVYWGIQDHLAAVA